MPPIDIQRNLSLHAPIVELDGDTHGLAQTIAARQVLQDPNHLLRTELRAAAGKLHQIYRVLHAQDQATAGLFAAERIKAGQHAGDLLDLLHRVAQDRQLTSAAAAQDRTAVIGLIGNLGAMYADHHAPCAALSHAVAAAGLAPPSPEFGNELNQQGTSPAARVKQALAPWPGHRSRPPAEILQTWDMLRAPDTAPPGAQAPQRPSARFSIEEQDQRAARAAGVCAFLVGGGWHSAAAVLEGAMAYLGQSTRHAGAPEARPPISGPLLDHGAATDLITALLRDHQQR
jgi:hypothetical protein